MNPTQLTPEEIRRRLEAFPPQVVNPYPEEHLPGRPRHAGVLLPLLPQPEGWHLLFIRRTVNDHDPHSGEVSFPGGQAEPDDPSPVHTALRETEEELGLPSEQVTVLGSLPLHRTASNFWVAPVVALLPQPLALSPSPAEVARVFTVPLAWLADPAHRETRPRVVLPHLPPVQAVFFQPYQGEVIWGATARMVLTLLRALGQG